MVQLSMMNGDGGGRTTHRGRVEAIAEIIGDRRGAIPHLSGTVDHAEHLWQGTFAVSRPQAQVGVDIHDGVGHGYVSSVAMRWIHYQ